MKHQLCVGVLDVDAVERERVKVWSQLHVARDSLHDVHHAAAPAREALEHHATPVETEQRVGQQSAHAAEQLAVVREHPLAQRYRGQHVLHEIHALR